MNDVDHYSLVEAAVMARFRTLTDHFIRPEHVANDDTVITRGGDCFAIFRPGSFPVSPVSQHEKNFLWSVKVDLYVRYTEYKTSWDRFKAVRAELINLVFPDPSLDGTSGVFSTALSSAEDAQYFYFKDDPGARPNFIIQALTVEVLQRVEFEF